MIRFSRDFALRAVLFLFASNVLFAQQALTWQQIKEKFEASNPTLKAAQLNIDESRAAQITAYLRPNPDLNLSTDGTQISRFQGVWRPFAGTQVSPGVSYLHERGGKRELRRDSAKQSTAVGESVSDHQKTYFSEHQAG